MAACTQECIEWIKVGIGALTPISIFIAYLAYRENLKKIRDDKDRERDKEYVSQIQKSLEWSFMSLTDDGLALFPRPNRLNWLTAARHILRARKISAQVTHPTYKTIAEEVEEYWRHKFYVVLSNPALRDWHYFMDKDSPGWPENIEISSALVVVDFSDWKDGVPDPTDAIDREKLIKQLKGGAGSGLRRYIAHLDEIKASRREQS